jgi:hypothetical protein
MLLACSWRRGGGGLLDRKGSWTPSPFLILSNPHEKNGDEVYGAPLKSIAKAASQVFGPMSRSGINNLLRAPRSNQVNTNCQGLIDARPARMLAIGKLWHSRRYFSSVLFKYWKEALAMIAADGNNCMQSHGDDMAAIPTGKLAARSKSSPQGFALSSIGFQQVDHNFPIASGMLINTTGWSIGYPSCTIEQVARPDGRVNLKTARPSSLHLNIRFKRFCPSNAVTHVDDLEAALDSIVDIGELDCLLVGVDNGGEYGVDSPVLQHLFYRLFRKYKLVVVFIYRLPPLPPTLTACGDS